MGDYQVGLVNSYESSMNSRFSDFETVESQRSIRELNEFIKLVKINNIQLGIVMFPRVVLAEGDIGKYPFSYLFDRVIYACYKNDIKCIDMRPEFAKENPKELWVNKFDGHPSALANKIVADIILQTFINEW